MCCQIYTQPRLPALAGLDRLIELYASRPLDAPVPLEIVLCVDKLVWSGRLKGKVLLKWTDRIDDLVSVSGSSESSSLSSYLERLNDSAQKVRLSQ